MTAEDCPTLGGWLEAEPFKLAMSAGYFAFYSHAGMMKALLEAGLVPSAVSGSSAGAIVAGLWAAGMEPDDMAAELSDLKRSDFWDPEFGLGLLKGRLIDRKFRQLLPVASFADCRVPVEMSVLDLLSRRTEVIDRGDLAIAMRASSAFPGLIQPVRINGRPKLDGGLRDWPALAGAGQDDRLLYHHINPRQSSLHITAEGVAEPYSNLQALEIAGLPQATPSALHKGVQAYRLAKAATAAALERPLGGAVILQPA